MDQAGSTALVHFDAARRALAMASKIDEVKQIRDQAEALRQYIRQQKGGLEMQNQAAEIKLRAERRAGEMLATIKPHEGGRPRETCSIVEQVLENTKLTDLGIDRHQSHRWQLEAGLPEEIFEQHIAEVKASGEELTSIGVLQLASRIQKQEAIKTVSMIEVALGEARKYRCIVIDPPWPIQKIEREERPMQGRDLDYPTMTIDEIGNLPILEQANPAGCHLYLWVTHKYLPVGLRLFESWGFRYQCLMTWVKPTGMTPYSWMYNTEHVLFGRVGGLQLERLGLKLSFDAPVSKGGHSRKPGAFYERVLEASPGPRLEMFARRERLGFDVWGNEVAGASN